MIGLIEQFERYTDVQKIINGIQKGLKEQLVTNLTGSSKTLLAGAIYKETNRTQLVVAQNLLQAQKMYEDLNAVVGENVYLYPANELIASEIAVSSPELRAQRLEVLNFLASEKVGIIITPITGVIDFLPSPELWKDYQITLELGADVDLVTLTHKLIQMGYERVSMVESQGEFSIRGGIIDLYPLTSINPLRIELFDTEIDSIRSFSVENQRSIDKYTQFQVGPATERLVRPEQITKSIANIEQLFKSTLSKVTDAELKEKLASKVGYEIEQLKQGQKIDQIYKYLSLIYEKPYSLIDYLSQDAIIYVDEISRVHEIYEQVKKDEAEWYTSLLSEGNAIQGLSFSHDLYAVMHSRKRQQIHTSLFPRRVHHTAPEQIVSIQCKTMQDFHGQMNLLKNELERWKKNKYTIVMLGASDERVNKIESILTDYDIEGRIISSVDQLKPRTVHIMKGDLLTGFELPLEKFALITEKELFTKKAKKIKRNNAKLTNAERIKNYSELHVGDYVVHVNHGIGKFLGIETLEINGVHKDYLHIRYHGDDKLFVPIEQIDQVQKYVGSEGKEPKIYKLGGSDWKKVKKKVEGSVQDIADDLIKLYAEREASKGYAFSPDTAEQQEFEGTFPYQETDDQIRSIDEIKKDMERERPMDRLLCGDVGYGKTEVAIRAAFKAIIEGKQVVFLVPTTILAQQHFETLRERYQDFPINIGLLNRFRSRKQQSETMKGLKDGSVDIVVGTHRLLSKDIIYKDLGLLIIDEEQRFGVTHKEKIKQLKANVDVLTLTATPIPRTLHMSMLGVRDLSVIETPPENRFPVQTYVVEYNPALVREAIERELARDGQIYFLYNRVEDIERMAERISMLVPEAKVAVAHGRLNEGELESVMYDFLEGQYDVLVSTTIIETGVDIPNVNTLIVYDADRMGLSTLYQLRGRVGRSNRVAYAYFSYKQDKVLTEIAEKRLQAIKEFTELGSGFKIAMRDLSIRGAGNLLGAQQHGFIDSVGFDLYSQMLKDAIEQRRGVKKEDHISVEIDLDVDAYIPDSYIQDSKQKIEMYKHFRGLETFEELNDLQDELIDRFGEFPIEVGYLCQIAYIKILAKAEKVELIKQTKFEVSMYLSEEASTKVDGGKLFQLCNSFGRGIGLGMEGMKLKITLEVKGKKQSDWLTTIEGILSGLKNVKKESVNA
jgi:transcription-repair coupling factor (superfamily II helicase)